MSDHNEIQNDENQEDLTEGIYQGEIKPSLEFLPLRKEFAPWHKPRKHYLRIKQWCHETQKLLRILKPIDELRYLGLPGDDLLDIRVLKGVCKGADVQLRYIGFNTSLGSPQLNLARHEVNSDEFIHSSSRVTNGRFEEVANRNTMAHKYVVQNAPFDVVNLDFCESVASQRRNGEFPTLEAIRELCDIQLRERGTKPWILFLTTRTVRETVNAAVGIRLFDRLFDNVQRSEGFSSLLQEKLKINEATIKAELQVIGNLNDQEWFRAYVLAVSKWLLAYMMNHQYSVAVSMLPSYAYSVHDDVLDMASLALLFQPSVPPREDPSGLTKPKPQEYEEPTEASLAIEFINSIAEIQDIDNLLRTNPELALQWYERSAALLGPLRYDLEVYENLYKPNG